MLTIILKPSEMAIIWTALKVHLDMIRIAQDQDPRRRNAPGVKGLIDKERKIMDMFGQHILFQADEKGELHD